MPTDVRRLFVLLCGYEILPKSVSVMGAGDRFILSEPICAYLLDTRQGWTLLDTGMDPAYVEDAALRDRMFLSHGMTPPVIRPQHRMERQLAEIGVAPADIRHVILSHLHFDHSGYLKHFHHARISIQRREHDAAMARTDPAYFPQDYDIGGLSWDLHDGDWQAMDGLHLLETSGHTAGHQSALVTLPRSGDMLLPFDAGDLSENFDKETAPGSCRDRDAALGAIRRLNRLREDRQATMLLFHDPVAIQAMRLAPLCYD